MSLKIVGGKVYKQSEIGDWLLSGKVISRSDGDYIIWYS